MVICDVLVIGAGASGLTAAFAAAQRGRKVIVLERNSEAAKKIYATGNGRCNFSNTQLPICNDIKDIMSECFGIEAAEEDGRVYPRSMEAASVAEAIIEGTRRVGVEILCEKKAVSVSRNAISFITECEDGSEYMSSSLILATGGKAGIQYGCYGDGYKFAKALGHSIVKPVPALDGMVCSEDISALHGVRVRAKASLLCSEKGGIYKEIAADTGEVQFTKDAISGICVMNLSRCLRLEEDRKFRLSLDLFPDESEEELAELFTYRKKTFGCGISWLIPGKLRDYLHDNIPDGKRGPAAMAAYAKNLCFDISGTRGWKTAQVTSGGVPMDEVDPYTFMSRTVEELYITGELLDYDGPCGGYNLTWAFHSGLSAGMNAAMGQSQQ